MKPDVLVEQARIRLGQDQRSRRYVPLFEPPRSSLDIPFISQLILHPMPGLMKGAIDPDIGASVRVGQFHSS